MKLRKPATVYLLLLLLLLSGCQQKPQEYRSTLLVFGTLINVTLWDVEPTKADAALATISEDLTFMHEVWHPWKEGPMGRTNQLLETTAEFSANPSVMPLLEKSLPLSTQSQGLFNPAIGKLVKLWGFHEDDIFDGPPPDAEQIAQLLKQNPQLTDIEINNIRMRSRNPAVKLDMGAIAKGLAVDRVISYLKSIDIHNAIVNAGGDLKAIGSHGERAWHVGIRHPREETIIASLDVRDNESVFTSGDYERYFEHEGKRYHHILDPRSGYPADSTTSVTVLHPDAATADAAATALFIAGPQQWHAIAKRMGIKHVMLIVKQGTVYLSPAMEKRIRFEQPILNVKISAPL